MFLLDSKVNKIIKKLKKIKYWFKSIENYLEESCIYR